MVKAGPTRKHTFYWLLFITHQTSAKISPQNVYLHVFICLKTLLVAVFKKTSCQFVSHNWLCGVVAGGSGVLNVIHIFYSGVTLVLHCGQMRERNQIVHQWSIDFCTSCFYVIVGLLTTE
jgi:hypothetical protein